MTAPASERAQHMNLRCRCGTEANPIPCKGGCGFICQRLPKRDERTIVMQGTIRRGEWRWQ